MKKKIVSTKYAGTKISIKRERGKIIFRKEPLNNMIFSNVIIWYSSNFFLLKAENVSIIIATPIIPSPTYFMFLFWINKDHRLSEMKVIIFKYKFR